MITNIFYIPLTLVYFTYQTAAGKHINIYELFYYVLIIICVMIIDKNEKKKRERIILVIRNE